MLATCPIWTDRYLWKHYIPETSFAEGGGVKIKFPDMMKRYSEFICRWLMVEGDRVIWKLIPGSHSIW